VSERGERLGDLGRLLVPRHQQASKIARVGQCLPSGEEVLYGFDMRSTMMTTPLQISRILRHGSTVHAGSEVITWTGTPGASRRTTFGEIGRQAARLANALRDDLGVTGDQRVATLMWNNAEHLTTYLAAPSMGAVLHTLNLRLIPDQIAYIANHAEDKIVIVSDTLIPLLAKVLPLVSTVEHVVVVGDGDATPLEGGSATVHRWSELLDGKSDRFDWPEVDENDAGALCYTSGTTGHPKGVAYSHRSVYLHSMQVCMAETFGLSPATRELCIVPMFHAMAWGLPYAAFMSGASLVMTERFLQADQGLASPGFATRSVRAILGGAREAGLLKNLCFARRHCLACRHDDENVRRAEVSRPLDCG